MPAGVDPIAVVVVYPASGSLCMADTVAVCCLSGSVGDTKETRRSADDPFVAVRGALVTAPKLAIR